VEINSFLRRKTRMRKCINTWIIWWLDLDMSKECENKPDKISTSITKTIIRNLYDFLTTRLLISVKNLFQPKKWQKTTIEVVHMTCALFYNPYDSFGWEKYWNLWGFLSFIFASGQQWEENSMTVAVDRALHIFDSSYMWVALVKC